MALYAISQGGLVNALDSQQIINLLTGVMSDQQVTVANRIRASLAGSTSGTGGYVGHTATGSPATGAHNAGDYSIATDGQIWICTTAGTPGTWVVLPNTQGTYSWTGTQTWGNAIPFIMQPGAAATALSFATAQSSAQTLTFPAIRQASNVAIQPQINFAALSNPTGTTSTTGVMMGLAGSITPQVTGRILVIMNGTIANNTLADGANVQLRTGTGGAPANAAALTGAAIGGLVKHVAATAAHKDVFCLLAIVTGLAINTAVWIDVGLAAVTGGTATITDVAYAAIEV